MVTSNVTSVYYPNEGIVCTMKYLTCSKFKYPWASQVMYFRIEESHCEMQASNIRSLAKLIWWREIASKNRQLFIENLSNDREKTNQMEWNEIGTKSIASFIALVRLIGCKLLKHRIEADFKRFSVDNSAFSWWKTVFRSLEICKWHFEIGF